MIYQMQWPATLNFDECNKHILYVSQKIQEKHTSLVSQTKIWKNLSLMLDLVLWRYYAIPSLNLTTAVFDDTRFCVGSLYPSCQVKSEMFDHFHKNPILFVGYHLKSCAMWCNSYTFLHHIICLLIYVDNQKLEIDIMAYNKLKQFSVHI